MNEDRLTNRMKESYKVILFIAVIRNAPLRKFWNGWIIKNPVNVFSDKMERIKFINKIY